MKQLLSLLLICATFLNAQVSFVKIYDQPQPPQNYYYGSCEVSQALKLADDGYLMSAQPWMPNIHMAYPIDYMTIRTNAAGAPSWKKKTFTRSLVLPSGSLMMLHTDINDFAYAMQAGQLTKAHLNGQAVWTRSLNTTATPPFTEMDFQVQDFAYSNGKVVCVGFEMYRDLMSFSYTIRGVVAEFDTLGNLVSQQMAGMPSNSANGRSAFERVIAVAQHGYLLGDVTGNCIHRINGSLAPVWSLEFTGKSYNLRDAHVLGNGNILCLLDRWGQGSDSANAIVCFNPAGGVVFAKQVPIYARFGGMVKASDGKFIITAIKSVTPFALDSLRNLVIKVDSNANVIWARELGQSIGIGKANTSGNSVFFSYYSKHLCLQSGNLSNGLFSCGSTTLSLSFPPITISTQTITQQLTQSSYSVGTATTFTNMTQSYKDTCLLGVGMVEENLSAFTIAPNPASNKLVIIPASEGENCTVKIYNAGGQLAIKEELSNREIDVSALPQGLYFAVSRNTHGKELRRKFLITR